MSGNGGVVRARSPALSLKTKWFVFVQQVDNESIYRAKEVDDADVAALDRLLVQSAEPFPPIERGQT